MNVDAVEEAYHGLRRAVQKLETYTNGQECAKAQLELALETVRIAVRNAEGEE